MYEKPLSEREPVVCVDEKPVVLHQEVRPPRAMRPGKEKPESVDRFLAAYAKLSKDDIRRNRENIAERLGFLGRIIHGSNPRNWAKELGARIGGTPDFTSAMTAI